MEENRIQLYEFGDYQTLPASVHLPDFKAYIKQLWANRHIFYETPFWGDTKETEEQQADLRKQGQPLLKFDGYDIQARNYVGFIYYNGLTIELLPKIFQDSGFSTPVVFQHLLFYLSYVPGFGFPFAAQSLDTWKQATPLQVYIHLFAAFTEHTLVSQAYVAYEEDQEPQVFMRGRLLTDEYLRHQLATGQWQHLQTRHAVLQYDNRFNQLVKYVTRWLLPLASAKTQPLLESVLFLLQEVSDQPFSYADIQQVSLNRLYENHEQLLRMCRFFMANQQLCPPQQTGSYFSFLLPMERVFEYFIAGFIGRHFPQWEAVIQSKNYLAAWQGGQVFQIINDIWIPRKGLVLDTKYKWLGTDAETLQKSISQADIYQMLAYAIRRHVTQVHLLYPGKAGALQTRTYEIEKALGQQTIYIHIHQLPVIVPEETLLTENSAASYLVPALQEKLINMVKGN